MLDAHTSNNLILLVGCDEISSMLSSRNSSAILTEGGLPSPYSHDYKENHIAIIVQFCVLDSGLLVSFCCSPILRIQVPPDIWYVVY